MVLIRALLLLGLVALAITAVAPAANATDYCNGNGQMIDLAGVVYVTIDSFMGNYFLSTAMFVESNGEQGLQRGGVSLLFGQPDACQDSPTPDLCIY